MDHREANLFDSINDLKQEFTRLMLNALKEGLSAVCRVKESGKYIGTYFDFANLSFKNNGLPSLASTFGHGPIEYRSCYNAYGAKPSIDENELQSYSDLVEFVRSHQSLHKRFIFTSNGVVKDFALDFDKTSITLRIKDCVERYIHWYKIFDYDKEKALFAVTPTISYIFDSQLNIDISIPILFLRFDFEDFQLTNDISIRKISEAEHKARYRIKSYNTSAHEQVMASATHALVFKGWYVPNAECMWDFDILSKVTAYPIEQIDHFFAALRISSDLATGYAQVYAIAKGWEANCIAELPHLQGVSLRAYPSSFENYYWNAVEVPIVSQEIIERIKITFNHIQTTKENAINLALKRLNRCLVRDDEEDAVLDATIALEALLSDGNQEMTHKLATRVGALSKIDKFSQTSPSQAFSDIKAIYSYRSAIVHGSKNPEKKRIIKVTNERSETAHALLIDHLRMTLRVLLENEKYRDPKLIDEELLLG